MSTKKFIKIACPPVQPDFAERRKKALADRLFQQDWAIGISSAIKNPKA